DCRAVQRDRKLIGGGLASGRVVGEPILELPRLELRVDAIGLVDLEWCSERLAADGGPRSGRVDPREISGRVEAQRLVTRRRDSNDGPLLQRELALQVAEDVRMNGLGARSGGASDGEQTEQRDSFHLATSHLATSP